MTLIPFIKDLRAALIAERDRETGGYALPTGLFDTKEIAVAIADYYTPDAVADATRSTSKLRLHDETVCQECGRTLNTRGIVFSGSDCYEHHQVEAMRKADLADLTRAYNEATEQAAAYAQRAEDLRARLVEARGY